MWNEKKEPESIQVLFLGCMCLVFVLYAFCMRSKALYLLCMRFVCVLYAFISWVVLNPFVGRFEASRGHSVVAGWSFVGRFEYF